MKLSKLVELIYVWLPDDSQRDFILQSFIRHLPVKWREEIDWDCEIPSGVDLPNHSVWITGLHVEAWPIWRYICEIYKNKCPEKELENRLAWMSVNFVIIYHLKQLDHKTAEQVVAMPFRHACKGKRFISLYTELAAPKTPEELIETVSAYVTSKANESGPYALSENDKNQLKKVLTRYESYQNERAGGVNSGSRKNLPIGRRGGTTDAVNLEKPSFSSRTGVHSEITELVDRVSFSHGAAGINRDEYLNDQPEPDVTVIDQTDRTSAKSSLRRQQYVVNGKIRAIRRRDMGFPTDSRALNLPMMQSICQNLVTQLNDDNEDNSVLSALVLTSVFTSTEPRDWLPLVVRGEQPQSISLRQDQNTYWIQRNLEIGRTEQWDVIGSDLFYNDSRFIEIPLPKLWVQRLSDIGTVYLSEFNVDTFIKTLGNNLGIIGLTQHRLKLGYEGVLKRHLNADVNADIITGTSPKHAPALFYISATREKIISLVTDAQKLLTGINNYSPNFSSNNDQKRIGSLRTPDSHIISTLMNDLCQSMKGTFDRYTRFQLFTIWFWHYALIMTGCRPVSGAPGTLSNVDRKLNFLTVSDKENRLSVTAERIIPITDQFIRVMDIYIDECQFIYEQSLISQAFSKGSEQLVDKEKPILNVFIDNAWTPVDRKIMNRLMNQSWLFDANWHRHYFRGIMSDLDVDHYVLKAVMGHELPDQEWLHPYSGVTLKDYDSIRVLIEKMSVEVLRLEMPY